MGGPSFIRLMPPPFQRPPMHRMMPPPPIFFNQRPPFMPQYIPQPQFRRPPLPTPPKNEWFEKTVRFASRVNSNLSYTLTQLNKAQSQANSVESLAVVHNRLQEVLSTSINSLIQIRKNLRSEFIAGIKNVALSPNQPPKFTKLVDPNIYSRNNFISVNPPPLSLPSIQDLPPSISATQVNMPVNNIPTAAPSKGFIKVKAFSDLQESPIYVPDEPAPPAVVKPQPTAPKMSFTAEELSNPTPELQKIFRAKVLLAKQKHIDEMVLKRLKKLSN